MLNLSMPFLCITAHFAATPHLAFAELGDTVLCLCFTQLFKTSPCHCITKHSSVRLALPLPYNAQLSFAVAIQYYTLLCYTFAARHVTLLHRCNTFLCYTLPLPDFSEHCSTNHSVTLLRLCCSWLLPSLPLLCPTRHGSALPLRLFDYFICKSTFTTVSPLPQSFKFSVI